MTVKQVFNWLKMERDLLLQKQPTDDRLSVALIQQLVYTNVTIMDQYLPGIQAVLSGEASLVEAIRAIEEPNIGTQPDADIQPNEQIQENDTTNGTTNV